MQVTWSQPDQTGGPIVRFVSNTHPHGATKREPPGGVGTRAGSSVSRAAPA